MMFELLLLAVVAPQETATDQAEVWFEDVAAEVGVDFVHVSGRTSAHWFPEMMGGGGAFLDYDSDGDLDLYCVQSGYLTGEREAPTNALFRNDQATFKNVTRSAGVGDRGYGMGAACADYDADGDVDLYVTNLGPNVLYRNSGDGTFADVSAKAGVACAEWSTSAAFFDYDADGALDLFVLNNFKWSPAIELECYNGYGSPDYCSPNNFNAPAPDVLYRNAGDGTFTIASSAAGIDANFGNGLGIALADFDSDGLTDVYVANDGMANQLWMNAGDGRFEDQALLAGCAVNGNGAPEAGMGVQAVDVDQDGDSDLLMTHLQEESNTYYRNRRGVFTDATALTGMVATSLKFTGFGMGFHDFDLDGQLDLFVANGSVKAWKKPFSAQDAYAEPNHLYRGLGRSRFELLEHVTQPPVLGTSRGAFFGDYDNDGDVDIAVVDHDQNIRLLRNRAQGNWIGFHVRNANGVDQVAARVQLVTADGDLWRQSETAYSYLCSSDPRVHFGLGSQPELEHVVVHWPGGVRERFEGLEPNAYQELRRGAGTEVD